MKQPQIAFFVGRFQPFHKGHYYTLLDLAQRYEKLIIGIGSAQVGFTLENPFTAKEREQMIDAALRPKKVPHSIFHIPDINDDDRWVKHVQSIVGQFDVAYSNNDVCVKLFQEAGIATFRQKMIERERFWGTIIRERMLVGKAWQHLMPPEVADILEKIHAVDRILTLAKKREVLAFEKKLPFTFERKSLLKTAFLHKSYLNEHKNEKAESNERLEFLGDAVLQLIVTDALYKKYKKTQEGLMTTGRSTLVRTETLAKVGEKLGLGEYVMMSFGEEKNGGRNNPTILACTLEALLGAMYLDQGYAMVQAFVQKHLLTKLPKEITAEETKDHKTRLQEYWQERYKALPEYVLVKEQGPDHDKEFVFEVRHEGKVLGKGKGKSKQLAQQDAARVMLSKLLKEKDS